MYTNKDVFHAEIHYARQGVPTGNFILKKDVTEVIPDDEIKIIGNHRHHLWDELTGSKTISTSTFHDAANGDFIDGGVNKGDYLYISEGSEIGSYKITSVDSATQITVEFTWTATESDLEYWIQKRRTVVSGTEGVTTISTDNFTDGTATFISNGIVAGDMLIIKGIGSDAGSYIVNTVDSKTQLSLNDHAGSPVSFSGDTELEYDVGMIIFDAYIEDLDIEEAQGIYAISKAQEILQNKPQFTHYGYSGVMFRKLLYEHTNMLQKPAIVASGNYTLRPLTDTHDSTDWSDSSGNNNGDMWDDIDESSPDSSYIWTETNNAMFSCSLNAVNLPTLYDSEIYKGNIAGRFRKPVSSGICNISFSILNGLGWTTPMIIVFPFGWGNRNIDDGEFSFSDDNFTPEIKTIFPDSNNVPAHIDQLYVTAYYRTYRKDNRIQGSTSILSISPGQSPIIDLFNLIGLAELKTWYLDPSFYLHFNNGDKVCGINLVASNKIGNIHGTRKIKSYDKVYLLGGYVNGVQITATAGSGNKIATETYRRITNQTILDNLASQLLTEKGYNQFDITLDYYDPEYGLIQAGETLNIAGGIKFDNVSRTIPANDYNIDSVTLYLSEDGVYSNISLNLVDFLIFSMPDEDDTKKNTKSGDDNATALNQVASSGVSIGGGAGGGGGEANVGGNVGTDGVGVYDGKSGATLQFRNIAPASNKITVTLNGKDIDIEAVAAEIEKEISLANLLEKSHGSLDGVEASQHHARYEDTEAVAAVEAAGLALDDGKVITSQDADLNFIFGRNKLGSYAADYAYFSHRDMGTNANYALRQSAAGTTALNAPTGQAIYHNINNSMKMVMSASALTMSIPIAMGTHKITGLGAPEASGDALRYENISDAVYDGDSWNKEHTPAAETTAPSQNAVRDVIEPLTSAIYYMGTWTPGTGYPADPRAGDFYIVDTDGYQAAVGSTPARWYEIGDWLVYNSEETMWDIIRNSYGDNVISVSPGDDIQVAIDEIESIGAGVIFLQPGTHTLSSQLTINNSAVDIIIRGCFDSTIIDLGGDRRAFYITDCHSCTLRDFKIDATDLTTQVLSIIDWYDASSATKIIAENISIYGDGTNGDGIGAGTSRCEINNCRMDNLHTGIYVPFNYCSINNNYITNCQSDGIYLSGDNNIIKGNICESNAKGINVAAGSYNLIDDNICASNSIYGIAVESGADHTKVGINQLVNNGTDFYDADDTTVSIERDMNAGFGIGIANKCWKNCILEGAAVFDDIKVLSGEYKNTGAGNAGFAFGIPLEYIKGTHNLVVTRVKISLVAADADDYILSLALNSWVGADSSVTQRISTNGDTYWKTPQVITWDIADLTVGGVFERVVLYIVCSNMTASQLEIGYVQVEYYYTE